MQSFHALFNAIRSFNNAMFLEARFASFLGAEFSLTLSMPTTVLQIFLNNMKLFVHKSGGRQQATEL